MTLHTYAYEIPSLYRGRRNSSSKVETGPGFPVRYISVVLFIGSVLCIYGLLQTKLSPLVYLNASHEVRTVDSILRRRKVDNVKVLRPAEPALRHHAAQRNESAKYLVMSAAVGYSSPNYDKFFASLRRHYSGDVILFIRPKDGWVEPILKSCYDSRIRLVTIDSTIGFGTKGDRYIAYAEYCKNYTFCFAVDFRDTFFQDDPFKLVPKDYHLVVTEEEKTGMGLTLSNPEWMRSCWGQKFLDSVFYVPPVCSGTIYGTPHGFTVLRDLMLPEMERSAQKKCIARDQGHFNYLLLTDSFPFPVYREIRGYGSVNTIGRVSEEQIASWFSEGVVKNEDGSASPVVHQYDRSELLKKLAETLSVKRPTDTHYCRTIHHQLYMFRCCGGYCC